MSLLEDVFLEDEAGEAQELERVIEGDEYDEIPVSPSGDENADKEDEAEEDKRRVDPTQGKTKRIVKNPRFILNPARLTGPRGIQVIPEHFKDFKFKGKGHEKEDLDIVLKKLEHWAYRLYPKFVFSDCLKKIETLGKKRPVMVHLHKIRHDQLTSEETVVQKDSSDDEDTAPPQEDEFDKLLQQQIQLARSTPMSVKKTPFTTPSTDRSLTMPKVTSSPSINEEQRERMLRNRKLAEERRLAKLKNNSLNNENYIPMPTHSDAQEVNDFKDQVVSRKHNRSNVIDSSSDDEEITVNESITVEIHNKSMEVNVDRENVDEIHEDLIHHVKSTAEKSDANISSINDIIDNVTKESDSEQIENTNINSDGVKEAIESNVETNFHTVKEKETDADMIANCVTDDNISAVCDNTIEPNINLTNDKELESISENSVQENSKRESNNENDIGDEIMDVDFDNE